MAMTGPGDYNAPVSCCGGQNPNSLLLYKCINLGILTLNCSLKKKYLIGLIHWRTESDMKG